MEILSSSPSLGKMHLAPYAVCSHRSLSRWPGWTLMLRRPLIGQPFPQELVASLLSLSCFEAQEPPCPGTQALLPSLLWPLHSTPAPSQGLAASLGDGTSHPLTSVLNCFLRSFDPSEEQAAGLSSPDLLHLSSGHPTSLLAAQ